MPEIKQADQGSLRYLTIANIERHNAITAAMWSQLYNALDAANGDDTVRALVLTGEGARAFSSGGDVGEVKQDKTAEDLLQPESALAPLLCDKPVIASVRGRAYGAGLILASACDMCVCSENAEFSLPSARIGVRPGYSGLAWLTHRIGLHNTLNIGLTARRFGAEEALRIGLVDEIVPEQDLERTVLDRANLLAANAPLTLKAVKRAVLAAQWNIAGRSDLAALNQACHESADRQEGLAALKQRRRPQFKGH